jgi:two-component system cell cycle sensor histidine kinase/response regulator CckA
MIDEDKTKEQLVDELVKMRQRVAESEESEKECKRVEETLRTTIVRLEEEKAKTEAIIAAIGDGIIIQDTDFKIIYQNQIQNELYGDRIGEYCYKAYESRDSICEGCPIELSFRDGKIHRAERSLTAENGVTYLELTGSPLRDSAGKIIAGVKVIRDITERKRIEEELLKSYQQQNAILNNISDIAWLKDKESRFIAVNRPFADACGMSPEELVGRTDLDIWQQELAQRYRADDREVMATGRRKQVEEPMVDKEGKKTWIETIKTPIYDNKGEVIGTTGVARDITERKLMEEKLQRAHNELEMRVQERTAELEEANNAIQDWTSELKKANEALQENEARYRELAESVGEVFYAMDRDLRYTYWNNASEALTGISAKDAVGKSLFEHFPELRGSKAEKLYKEVLKTQQPQRFVNKYRAGDKNLVFEINAYPSKFGISIIAKDITERRRAEEKVQEQAALLDKAHDAIAVYDMEHCLIYWNKGAERLYGWKAEEVTGRALDEFQHKEESLQLIEAKKRVVEEGEWTGELRQVTKEGKEIIVESRWTLVHDSKGKPESILAINTDITAKKNLETQLLRTQRLESIGTLASGISHDINNVLSPIMMSLQLLQERFQDDESRKLLDILERSTQRGADLVKQVQSFARGVKGERAALQVTHIATEIRQIIKETFPKSIEIRIDISGDLWMIMGDATQLHQVLMNLCVNARDAMPDGGVLGIYAENIFIDENYARMNIEAKVGRYIVITVSDTGTGIPHEIMDRIFDPFFTTKKPGKGTGLGLSTALAIVKSHGGFINVYSEVNRGTTFKIYLPAVKTNIAQEVEEHIKLPAGQGELILVVDDEAQIREIASLTLETHGYRVLTANDGAEAIAVYTQNSDKIKVVLMDMMMPVMDGPASIRELRKINPEVKIIAFSGLTERNRLARVAINHIHAFLPKPFTSERLLKAIYEVINAK